MIAPEQRSAAQEWRENWPLVLAGLLGMAVGSLHAYSLGVMIAPLEAEFGWKRAQISSGLLITSTIAVLFAPFMGMAIDRIGPRTIATFGVTFYCFALALLSQASESLWTWHLLWLLLGVALLHIKATVWVAAITGVFTKSRGLALAVVLSGSGVSTFSTPIISQYLVSEFGWRTAYIVLGGGWGLVAVPLIAYGFSVGRRARQRAADRRNDEAQDAPGVSLREGFLSLTFARMAAGIFVMTIASIAVVINLVPVLRSTGIDAATAAALAGMQGLAAVTGRLSAGYLLDRFNARIVAAASVTLPALACLILLFASGSPLAAIPAVILLGLGAGAELDAVSYMSSRYFGSRNFGTLFGTLVGLMTLGVGIGPVLANHVYDLTGTYHAVLWAAVPLSLATALLFGTARPFPDFSREAYRQRGPIRG